MHLNTQKHNIHTYTFILNILKHHSTIRFNLEKKQPSESFTILVAYCYDENSRNQSNPSTGFYMDKINIFQHFEHTITNTFN